MDKSLTPIYKKADFKSVKPGDIVHFDHTFKSWLWEKVTCKGGVEGPIFETFVDALVLIVARYDNADLNRSYFYVISRGIVGWISVPFIWLA